MKRSSECDRGDVNVMQNPTYALLLGFRELCVQLITRKNSALSALEDLGTDVQKEMGQNQDFLRQFQEFDQQLRTTLDNEFELLKEAESRFEQLNHDETRVAITAAFRPDDRDEALELIQRIYQVHKHAHEIESFINGGILLKRLWQAEKRFNALKSEDTDEHLLDTVRTLLSLNEELAHLRRSFWETVDGTTKEATAPIELRLQELRDRARAPEA